MFLCLLTHLTTFCFRYNTVYLKSIRDSEDVSSTRKCSLFALAGNFNIIRGSVGQGWVLVSVGLNCSLVYFVSMPWAGLIENLIDPYLLGPPKWEHSGLLFRTCTSASYILEHWNLANVLTGRLNVCLRQAPALH